MTGQHHRYSLFFDLNIGAALFCQQRGCCITGDGKYETTIYTSCCNTDKGIYYYNTYDNHQIAAINMHNENLDGDLLIKYPLIQEEQFKMQN